MYIVRPSSAATEKAAETASDRYQMNIPCECTSVTAACPVAADVGGGARRGSGRPVACSKAAIAASQLVRLSSGSHVSPAVSRPVQRTST